MPLDGVIVFRNRACNAHGDGPWSDDDLKLLVLIAKQAASAIGFARQRNEQSKTERLASIGRMLAGRQRPSPCAPEFVSCPITQRGRPLAGRVSVA